MGLDAAVKAAAGLVRAVSGVRAAPEYPEEAMNVYPFAVAFVESGRLELLPGLTIKGLHNIVVQLHVVRKDLERDIEAAMAFADSVPVALLADPTLGGTVQTFGQIAYTFGPMSWGKEQTLGFQFVIEDVKIIT